MNTDLSSEELQTLASLLSKLAPGVLPVEIFHQITRIVAMPIIEVVPLRKTSDGDVEVLLLRREADDPVWPNKLHVPGTVVRASDTGGDFSEAFDRILSVELKGAVLNPPVFFKNIIHHSGRGMEVSQIYWSEIIDNRGIGELYPASRLPVDLVESQLDFIPMAVEAYQKSQG